MIRRRRLLFGSLTAQGGLLSCKLPDGHASTGIRGTQRLSNLQVLCRGSTAIDPTNGSMRRIISPTDHMSLPIVSPNAEKILWLPVPPVTADHEASSFLRIRTLKSERKIDLGRRVALDASVSNQDVVVLLIVPSHSLDRPVMWTNGQGLLRSLSLGALEKEEGSIERLSVSGDGAIAAAGTRERFALMQIDNGSILSEGIGRFPAISPAGAELAYVQSEQLVIRNLSSGHERKLLRSFTVFGVGQWDPRSELLLVAARRGWSIRKQLLLVDTLSEAHEVIGALGEGDFGDRCRWVQTELVKSYLA